MNPDPRLLVAKHFDFIDGFAVNKGADFLQVVQVAPVAALILRSTNASPIQITTETPHGLTTGNSVIIVGHAVNTAANVTAANPSWVVTVIDSLNFTLNSSVGNGVGGASGEVCSIFDLTGYTAEMQIMDSPGGNIIITPSVTIPTPTNGQIQISIPAANTLNPVVPNTNVPMADDPVDTTTRPVNSGMYELWIKNSSYAVKILSGVVQFATNMMNP